MKVTMIMMTAILACSLMINGGSALAHGGHSAVTAEKPEKKTVETPKLSIQVNGVAVQSDANHLEDGKAYASVQAFAELMGTEVFISETLENVQLGSKTLTDVRVINGEVTAWVRELAEAVGAQQISWDGEAQEVYMLVLPAGTIQMDPQVVPAMGEHWGNPAAGELPRGPIYGVYKGKLVFLEYMIAQDDFSKGIDHVNMHGMKGLPMPAIVQTDIEFQRQGHPGFEIPHYDFHFYFISDEEQQAIQ